MTRARPSAELVAVLDVLAVNRKDRRAQLHFGTFRQREDGFENLAGRAAGRGLAGAGTVRLADRREQQVQITRDVGHRPDGGPRVVRQRLLLDGDDRREPEHEVDVRLGHLRHEPLRVTRKRFHVPALALGVDRVEREAGLARTGQAGHDDERVAWNLDGDILEVVDARALHRDRRARGGA